MSIGIDMYRYASTCCSFNHELLERFRLMALYKNHPLRSNQPAMDPRGIGIKPCLDTEPLIEAKRKDAITF